MSIDNFIPAVWSAQILKSLPQMSVYSQVANRDYEGEIKDMGDQVKINSVGNVTIKPFTKNSDIAAPDTLTDAQKILLIDQGDYFNFQVDDVDKTQTKPKVIGEATENAASGLANVADVYMAGLYIGADAGNFIGSESSPKTLSTAADAYNYLVDLGVVLDESKTPKIGRWVIVPAWFHGLLRKDNRFVQAGTDTNNNILFTGVVGQVAGFQVYVSNNVPYTTTTTKFKIQAGYAGTLSYAEQILFVEAYRPEKRFADAIKGLHVYGAKLVRPTTMAVLIVNRPA
jgi:N4-gp56 family major capsid protein